MNFSHELQWERERENEKEQVQGASSCPRTTLLYQESDEQDREREKGHGLYSS